MVATALKTVDDLAAEPGKLITDPRTALLVLQKGGVMKVIAWEDLLPGTLPARGSENVEIDLLPRLQPQGTLATGNSVNFDVPLAVGKRYNISADVWVDNGAGGAVLFTKSVYVVAHQTGGAAVKVLEATVHDNAGAGFAFTCAASGTNIRFTLSNTSGNTRSYNCPIGVIALDKP